MARLSQAISRLMAAGCLTARNHLPDLMTQAWASLLLPNLPRVLSTGLSPSKFKNGSVRNTFFVNYVLSWNYSDDDEGTPYEFRYADVLDFKPEYSYSDRDQRHHFNAAAMFELPYDFIVSVAVQAQSASPDSLFLLSDVNEDGNAFDRAFVGRRDVGRNTVRKKNRRSSVDVRVSRMLKRREKKRVELFAEIFNMFNSNNLSPLPNSLLLNFDTRMRAGTGDARQLQLGIRFSF